MRNHRLGDFAYTYEMIQSISYSDLLKDIFNPVLTRYCIPENERRYILKFYLMGITAIVMEWLDDNCTETIDSIGKIITDCVIGKLNEQNI